MHGPVNMKKILFCSVKNSFQNRATNIDFFQNTFMLHEMMSMCIFSFLLTKSSVDMFSIWQYFVKVCVSLIKEKSYYLENSKFISCNFKQWKNNFNWPI